MNRILIISEPHLIKTFMAPVIERLKKETKTAFDCFIITGVDSQTEQEFARLFERVFVNKYPKGFVKKIPRLRILSTIYGLRKISRELPHYDIAHINYHHYYLAFCAGLLRRKAEKLYVTFFGSDFNQVEWFRHMCNRYTITRSDAVFATNRTLLNSIIKHYELPSSGLSTDILFPLMGSIINFREFLHNNTREHAKEALGYSKKMIVCGYNASHITNHDVIIGSLIELQDIISDYMIVFPMTYGAGGDLIRTKVKDSLIKTALDYTLLEDYLTTVQLHNLRLAADIFVNIQSRDQMSASMLEHLAAGSVVITGSWLPYESLIEMGIYFICIHSPKGLTKAILEAVSNLEYHKKRSEVNRQIVLNMMSWETIKVNWHKYYNSEIKE